MASQKKKLSYFKESFLYFILFCIYLLTFYEIIGKINLFYKIFKTITIRLFQLE
ncbi:hypothetical protein HMPREF3033_01321 [Veillonellaceae bacterium DNF00751]|nr:hypothetical protein HMPREF3033_01321 [Veillonellaceae bacterium DNF00751]